jgi:neutral ceramidase
VSASRPREGAGREVRAGFAAVEITPLPGAEMPGAFQRRTARGVHDPLYARACLLENGAETLALVQADCLSLKRSVVRAARRLAAEWCGVPVSLLAAATHTHSGGPTSDCFGSSADPAYLRYLAERMAMAATLAYRAREPALLAAGSGSEGSVVFNRRFHMRSGGQATHPGKGNPEILLPAGPVDPELGVLGVWAMDGRPLGAVLAYTCHCTVMNTDEYSADYPCWLHRGLREALGDGIGTVFLNGAFADVTQVANTVRREPEFGEKWARRLGTVLAGEALKVLAALEPRAGCRLAAATREVTLQPRQPTAKQLEDARALLAGEGPWNTERWYARELVLLAEMNVAEPVVAAEVQVLALGEVAVVGVPAELFCAPGLELKRRSPFPRTWIAGLANGCVGYVPTAEALGPRGGGYEPRLCRSSKLAPEAAAVLTGAALALLAEVAPPAAPQEPAPAAGTPWEAGASPPGT